MVYADCTSSDEQDSLLLLSEGGFFTSNGPEGMEGWSAAGHVGWRWRAGRREVSWSLQNTSGRLAVAPMAMRTAKPAEAFTIVGSSIKIRFSGSDS